MPGSRIQNPGSSISTRGSDGVRSPKIFVLKKMLFTVNCQLHCSITNLLHYSRIYLDMLNVYKVMSENITAAITHNGEQVGIEKLVDPSGLSLLD